MCTKQDTKSTLRRNDIVFLSASVVFWVFVACLCFPPVSPQLAFSPHLVWISLVSPACSQCFPHLSPRTSSLQLFIFLSSFQLSLPHCLLSSFAPLSLWPYDQSRALQGLKSFLASSQVTSPPAQNQGVPCLILPWSYFVGSPQEGSVDPSNIVLLSCQAHPHTRPAPRRSRWQVPRLMSL